MGPTLGNRVTILAISLIVLFVGMAAYHSGPDAGSEPPALITEKIDAGKLVTLVGNTRPEANAANDRGAVADDFPMQHMLLQLRRSPQRERAFEGYLDELSDPKSPNYHHWLSAQEIGQKYGLANRDLDIIRLWLESHRFAVNKIYPNRMVIDFSGTAGQVRHAFHTEIHYLVVNGRPHTSNVSDPRIPAALAPAVVGVVSLNDFKPMPQYGHPNTHSRAGAGTVMRSHRQT
jgi:pro-kumamolisin-like protein